MSSRTQVLRLVVRTSKHSIKVLKYIAKHIARINSRGTAVHITRLLETDDNTAIFAKLRAKGVTMLPAMLFPNNKWCIGSDEIIGALDRMITPTCGSGPLFTYSDPIDTEIGETGNSAVDDYFLRTVYSGVARRGRHLVPPKERDGEEERGNDIERRMAEYNRNVPAHRRQDRGDDFDDVPARRRPSRRPAYIDTDADDNVADSDDERSVSPPPRRGRGTTRRGESRRRGPDDTLRGGRLTATGDAKADYMDQRMLDAWSENIPQED